MAYNDDLITTIDYRIAAALGRVTAAGTVQTVDAVGGRGATVVFYGASTPVPVKRAGHVDCLPGDKVGLLKVERDWWIIHSAPRRDAPMSLHTFSAGVVTPDAYTGITYQTLPNAPTFELTKRYDASYIEVDARMGAYATVGTVEIGVGVLVNGVDYDITTFFMNALSDHKHWTAIAIILSAVPAGTYTVEYRWKRTQASGQMNLDENDRWAFRYTERF